MPIPTWGVWCLMLLTVVLIYGRALHAPFLLDDLQHITASSEIRSNNLISTNLFTRSRAIPILTFRLNYAWSELQTYSYHLINFLIHVANGILLFHLASRILKHNKQSIALAFPIAFLWLIHPLASQAVIYTIQRAEIMASFAYLFSLYAITCAASSPKRTALWQILGVLSCIAGLYCKPILATLPMAALLWDRVLLTNSFKATFKQRGLMHAALFVSLLFLAVIGTTSLLSIPTDGSANSAGLAVQTISPMAYLFAQSRIILHYLSLCVWPIQLVFDYGWPPPQNLGDYAISFGLMTILFLISVGLLFTRYAKAGMLMLLFFLILAPTSSMVPIIDLAVEHRMYLPLACVIGLLVMLIDRLLKNYQRTSLVLFVFVTLFLGIRTYLRAGDYQTQTALWQTVIDAVPTHPRAWYFLGRGLEAQKNPQQAMLAYERAIEYSGNDQTTTRSTARIMIGKILLDQKQPAQAIVYLNDANTAHEYFLLASAYRQTNDLITSKKTFEKCIQLEPQRIVSYLSLSEVFYQLKQIAPAIATLNDALLQATANKDKLTLHKKLAQLCQISKQFDLSLEHLNAAMAISPNAPEVQIQLAALHANLKQWQKAHAIYDRLYQTSAPSPQLLKAYAWLLATCPDKQINNGAMALQLANQLPATNPVQAIQKLDMIAAAHGASGNFDQAVHTIHQAIALATKYKQQRLVQRLKSRLDFYVAKKPYLSE